MNGAVDSMPAEQFAVGCIHDGIDILSRDVFYDNGDEGLTPMSLLHVGHPSSLAETITEAGQLRAAPGALGNISSQG